MLGTVRRRPILAALPPSALLAAFALSCSWPKREPWELAPLPPGGIEVTKLASEPPLDIERVRFQSRATGDKRFFIALVPSARPVRDVLIFNHGWWDRPEDLLRELKIDRVYARLLTLGQVRPAVVVLPDVRFSNFFRRHSERFPYNQTLDLIASEISGDVSRRYGIAADREHWAVGGFSFGGYVALDVARRFAGRFGSASVLSAFYDEDWTFWPSEPPPPGKLDASGRGKQTIVAPGPVPRLFLACGTDDRMYASMVALHRLLTARGIAHEWSTGRGGHTWEYWSSVLEPLLRFHLAGPGAPAAGGR
jgi:putative tributyrin esterase